MSRGLWFIAGAGAGVWGMARARRAAEAVTRDGVRDRLHALALGARLVREEFTAGAAEREAQLREELGLADGRTPQLGQRRPTDEAGGWGQITAPDEER